MCETIAWLSHVLLGNHVGDHLCARPPPAKCDGNITPPCVGGVTTTPTPAPHQDCRRPQEGDSDYTSPHNSHDHPQLKPSDFRPLKTELEEVQRQREWSCPALRIANMRGARPDLHGSPRGKPKIGAAGHPQVHDFAQQARHRRSRGAQRSMHRPAPPHWQRWRPPPQSTQLRGKQRGPGALTRLPPPPPHREGNGSGPSPTHL